MASNDFLIRRHWHSCGDVARGGCCEILDFLKEARRGADWHLFCNSVRADWNSGHPRIRLVIDIYCPLVASLREDAGHRLF